MPGDTRNTKQLIYYYHFPLQYGVWLNLVCCHIEHNMGGPESLFFWPFGTHYRIYNPCYELAFCAFGGILSAFYGDFYVLNSICSG